MKRRNLFVFLLPILFTACATSVANPSALQPATALPTANPTAVAGLCASASLGARDWEETISALEALNELGQTCADDVTRIALRLASAYFGLGTQLEAAGDEDAAIEAYESALIYSPTMQSAQQRLELLTTETSSSHGCSITQVNQGLGFPAYEPTTGDFAELTDSGFVVDGALYFIYGANYYPRDTPFEYFLVDTNIESVIEEFALMSASGLNTLRVFLIYETLFSCTESGLQPNEAAFTLLDEIIQAAAEAKLRLILVLNHTLDPLQPAITMPESAAVQTAFIVSRYAQEPTILAWDLRDRGNQDYVNTVHSRQEVLAWLADTAILVRSLDEFHPITAGWQQTSGDTAPLVDFVSFQSFGEYETLRQDIASLRAVVNKPILLAAVGYSTYQLDETSQRNLLYQTFEEVSHNDLLGWMVYMAFDYPRTVTCTPPDCPGEAQPINHFGLWNTSYFPKLAVDAVEVITGVE